MEKETGFECGFPVESCEGCPIMAVSHEDWHEARAAHGMFSEAGKLLVGNQGRVFDENIAHLFGEGSEEAEVISSYARQQVAEVLDAGDEKLSMIAEDAQELSDSCEGPLAMKAKKHGTTYVVRICTSPIPHGPDKTAVVPAEVTRNDRRR